MEREEHSTGGGEQEKCQPIIDSVADSEAGASPNEERGRVDNVSNQVAISGADEKSLQGEGSNNDATSTVPKSPCRRSCWGWCCWGRRRRGGQVVGPKLLPELPPGSDNVTKIPNQDLAPGEQPAHMVKIPEGVQDGQQFPVIINGQHLRIVPPPPPENNELSKLAEIELSYDKCGWTRTLRATDMKFQWTRFDEEGNVDERTRFDTERSAYVLKLDFLDGNDRMRQGRLSLVTPEKGGVDSKINTANGTELVSYTDIATVQRKSFGERRQWFQDTCAQLCVERSEGYVCIKARRFHLVSDSMEAMMSLTWEDMRKVWRFDFAGEVCGYAEELAREWFELVMEEAFDPDMGLWQRSVTNQMCMQINPASEISCPDEYDHLLYFRFIGRVMGKALFDRQLVKGHMVKHLYKHILGWPVMFNDLKDVDDEYYDSLKGLQDMGSDVEYVCLDFTVLEETLGAKQTVELIPGGADVDVVEDNLPEYIEACLKRRLLGRYEAQLNEILLGIFDVIPEPLLTVFDFQELEWLMCGLPDIDIANWMEHTEYSGGYAREGPNHQVCIWFWEIVSEFDHEMRARLLQFVTGSSEMPERGFSFLQCICGNVRKFTIHGVTLGTCVYPRSHTHYNRIDLPLYETRDECEEKLKTAITMEANGLY